MQPDTRIQSPLHWRKDAKAFRRLAAGLDLSIDRETLVLAWLFGCTADTRRWSRAQHRLAHRVRDFTGGSAWN